MNARLDRIERALDRLRPEPPPDAVKRVIDQLPTLWPVLERFPEAQAAMLRQLKTHRAEFFGVDAKGDRVLAVAAGDPPGRFILAGVIYRVLRRFPAALAAVDVALREEALR